MAVAAQVIKHYIGVCTVMLNPGDIDAAIGRNRDGRLGRA
jgi:hypothetical protein